MTPEESDWDLYKTIFGKAPVVRPEARETFEDVLLLTEIGHRILREDKSGQGNRPQIMRAR